ncbi:NAD(P)-binding protein [Paramyrothecium foliicola]|nr:NAD(P)-binding protein [Paramyrothecium foliicola]
MSGFLSRVWTAFNPPTPPKVDGALKFGILGAANIAPMSLIIPAKSHPEVIVKAVAARDRARAEAFAKANGIPEVRDSYQEILDDPDIDCVFIPLPNALHYEWAVRAIRAGKSVLVEKPSVSNSREAEILFNLPELSQPNGPVLLEGFHSRFHPSWQLFMAMFKPEEVASVVSHSSIPWWGTSKTDIHFNYPLSGGSMMSMGTYNYAALRLIFDANPEECISCEANSYTDGIHDKCDWDFNAKFRFPGGRIGEAASTLRGGTMYKAAWVEVKTVEAEVPDASLPEGQTKFCTRELRLADMIHGAIWHRIDVKTHFEIRTKDGAIVKKWTEAKSQKAYSFKEAGGEFANLPGEVYWMSFRHQLEQFVNKVKGRKTQFWISGEDSIAQMKMIDMAYEKCGLGPRPMSNFR